MNKQTAEGMFAYFRMVLGVTRKLVEQFPEDKMGYKPIEPQRTAAEVIVHMYAFLVEAMEAIRDGKYEMTEPPKLTAKSEILAYMDSQVEKAYKIFGTLTEAQLAATITSYGKTMPAWQFLSFAYDEHWHHRGALTVYLRLCGVEPIMIYSYE
jgi:uncharacterized damage-inducible protein DinB